MYYVYKVKLPFNYVYIGTTNNIRRRKDQHNGNAKTEKSYFGKFLKENNIILKKDDFEILFKSNDRKKALEVEEHYIKLYDDDSNYISLNEAKTKREKKKVIVNKTCLEYVVIDIKEHKWFYVKNMREYELQNGFCIGCLHRTVNKENGITKKRYKAFYLEEWNNLENDKKEYYLSGNFLIDKNKKIIDDLRKRSIKKYLLENKNGEKFIVENLDEFANINNINSGDLHNSYNNKHWCKGFRVIERL